MFLEPGTTAGKIDEYGTRFTIVNGAHFLIAGNGEEAWPISAAEALDYQEQYRRRMLLARWLRRLVVLSPILIVLLNIFLLVDAAEAFKQNLSTIAALLLIFGIPLSFLLHTAMSDLAKAGIERRLKHRITTRLPEAITPKLSPAGWWGRRLLFAFVAIELGIAALRLLFGRHALGGLTGNLAWMLQFVLMLGIVLVIVDRRSRQGERQREQAAEALSAKDEARAALLRQLAAEAGPPAATAAHASTPLFGRKAVPPS